MCLNDSYFIFDIHRSHCWALAAPVMWPFGRRIHICSFLFGLLDSSGLQQLAGLRCVFRCPNIRCFSMMVVSWQSVSVFHCHLSMGENWTSSCVMRVCWQFVQLHLLPLLLIWYRFVALDCSVLDFNLHPWQTISVKHLAVTIFLPCVRRTHLCTLKTRLLSECPIFPRCQWNFIPV